MLYGNWLVLPVLFPIFGGLMAARIHTLGARRTVVSTILILQILLIALLLHAPFEISLL